MLRSVLPHVPVCKAESVLRSPPAAAMAKGVGAGGGWHPGPASLLRWGFSFPDKDLGVSTCCCVEPGCQPPARAHAKPPCLFCLKAVIPQSGVGVAGDAHSGLIAFNESDGAGCQQAEGFAKVRALPVRTAGVWCGAAPGFATAPRKDLRAPAALRRSPCAARPMPSAQPALQGAAPRAR